MAGIGRPTDTDEFIRVYARKRSDRIRGIMGREVNRFSKDISVLDVGCGIGNTLFALGANGFGNIVGFDVERQLVEYAKNSVPAAHVVVASAEEIPFRDGAFDCVICYDLLEHVLKPETVVENISRVLKQNGILYLSVANGYSINDVLFRLGGRIIRGRSSHVQKFRRRDVETLLRNKSFEIEKIAKIRDCVLDYACLPGIEGILFSSALKTPSRTLGKYMSARWELKATKRGRL